MFFGRKEEIRAFDRLWVLSGASLAVCLSAFRQMDILVT